MIIGSVFLGPKSQVPYQVREPLAAGLPFAVAVPLSTA